MKVKAPAGITYTSSTFCPGCGHGLIVRLIAEVMEEMNLSDKLLVAIDVACCALAYESWRFDTVLSAHGRPVVTAIGIKKVRKKNPVLAYLGDGAAYSIGLAETMHAAIRNDNVVTIIANNTVYGMTGGQTAPTTLPGQRTTSSPHGRDPEKTGKPFRIEEALSGLDVAYLARGALTSPAEIQKTKKMVRKAFEKHMANEGFSLVEILSPCPTNLNLTPVKNMQRITEEVIPIFPLGEFKNSKEA